MYRHVCICQVGTYGGDNYTHFNIQGDDIHVIRKLRQMGRHSAMREIAINIVRASVFCLEMYAK